MHSVPKHTFNKEDTHIRPALPADKNGLIKMAKTIWDGGDYLPKIVDTWIAEGGFFVAEWQSQIIGCTKITMFPRNVMWFEGLRVHSRYQGKGIGKLLNAFGFRYAMAQKESNPHLSFEFCTYYKNVESIHLARKLGFKVLRRFYVLSKRGVDKCLPPMILDDYDISIFHNLPSHIPCGWRALHNHPDSLSWIKDHCKVFQTPQGRYLLAGISGLCIIPLDSPPVDIGAELPYFQTFYGPRKSIELILPLSWKAQIPYLKKKGFRFWDKETKANMLIFGAE